MIAAIGLASGCDKKKNREDSSEPAASASAEPFRLTPEQEKLVLAKVGDRTITLGDYAATLERMDPFERLRYQSTDRRRVLLKEMIDVELLAQEAKRRGLDRQPETQERLRQILRDELLRQVRESAPLPSEIPETEVRRYYDAHRADFDEPERRRVSHIVTGSKAVADAALEKAQEGDAAAWGKLVERYSLDRPEPGSPAPLELAGDLGIVGPPGHPRGENPRVPEEVRTAVFRIGEVGQVLPEPVKIGARFHVVRLTAKTPARTRSLAEAERTIRIALVQERVKEREAQLERELKARYPVTIDSAALATVKPLPPKPRAETSADRSEGAP